MKLMIIVPKEHQKREREGQFCAQVHFKETYKFLAYLCKD